MSAVVGSHGRVQTADERLLPGGTAVICDAGRTGSVDSVGGCDPASRVNEFLSGIPDWTKDAWARPELQGVLIEWLTGKGLVYRKDQGRLPGGSRCRK
jgi:calcineurin-like phosphoesterase